MVWRLVLEISNFCDFAPLRALRETRQRFKSRGWFKGFMAVQNNMFNAFKWLGISKS